MVEKAIIAKIDSIEEIPGADNIQIAYVLGDRVIVGKNTSVGYMGIYFPAELQLSHEYCHFNNLYRHSENNSDMEKRGFFEDNRRVKAMKLLKVKSEGYFAELSSLSFTGYNIDKFKLGDEIQDLNKINICKKYISPRTKIAQERSSKSGVAKIQTPLFHQHVDTSQFKHYISRIPLGATLSFHAKLHGTSARYSHTKVKRGIRNPLDVFEFVCKKIGIRSVFKKRWYYNFYSRMSGWCNIVVAKFGKWRWEYVAGTRRVVLYQEHRNKEGFNGPEEWRFQWLDELEPYLNKGLTVYGEIVGFANGSPIMGIHNTEALKDKKYTKKYGDNVRYDYNCLEGEHNFHIYRISATTEDGDEYDFSVDQVVGWCQKRGFKHTLEVAPRMIYDGDVDKLMEVVTNLTERPDCLTEDYLDPSHINEGIVIRVDYKDSIPTFYKNKSWAFKVMEGIYNENNISIEDAS